MSHEVIAFLIAAVVLVIGSRHDANAKQERLAETWYHEPLPLRPYDYETDGI